MTMAMITMRQMGRLKQIIEMLLLMMMMMMIMMMIMMMMRRRRRSSSIVVIRILNKMSMTPRSGAPVGAA